MRWLTCMSLPSEQVHGARSHAPYSLMQPSARPLLQFSLGPACVPRLSSGRRSRRSHSIVATVQSYLDQAFLGIECAARIQREAYQLQGHGIRYLPRVLAVAFDCFGFESVERTLDAGAFLPDDAEYPLKIIETVFPAPAPLDQREETLAKWLVVPGSSRDTNLLLVIEPKRDTPGSCGLALLDPLSSSVL